MHKITAIGEILFDIYPEKKLLGGAPFNFINHIWKITGNANFISCIGNDENGKEIVNYLNSTDFNTKYISFDEKHPTGTVHFKLREDKTPQFTMSSENSGDFLVLNESIDKKSNRFAADICMVDGAIPAEDSIYSDYCKIFSSLNRTA